MLGSAVGSLKMGATELRYMIERIRLPDLSKRLRRNQRSATDTGFISRRAHSRTLRQVAFLAIKSSLGGILDQVTAGATDRP